MTARMMLVVEMGPEVFFKSDNLKDKGQIKLS